MPHQLLLWYNMVLLMATTEGIADFTMAETSSAAALPATALFPLAEALAEV